MSQGDVIVGLAQDQEQCHGAIEMRIAQWVEPVLYQKRLAFSSSAVRECSHLQSQHLGERDSQDKLDQPVLVSFRLSERLS